MLINQTNLSYLCHNSHQDTPLLHQYSNGYGSPASIRVMQCVVILKSDENDTAKRARKQREIARLPGYNTKITNT